MAELSGHWTTTAGGTGHQQTSYTQAQLSTAYRVLAGAAGYEGVVYGLSGALVCAANGANTVSVATGGAVVDGKWYYNDASLNVNIPSAVGAGNTRIDRIVLRGNWAGYKVAVARIAGTDAASPVAPAITQTSGTTYDIMLCRVLVNTTGTVTVTDERVLARPTAPGYSVLGSAGSGTGVMTALTSADGEVLRRSGATLGFGKVEAASIGTMIPVFVGRQSAVGGNWSYAGTTNYTSGLDIRMQCGAVQASTTGNTGTITVTFPVAYTTGLPIIFAIAAQGNEIVPTIASNLGNKFSIIWYSPESRTNPIFYWFAMGPV